jgi:DNA-binding transcriptional MocR family regulator
VVQRMDAARLCRLLGDWHEDRPEPLPHQLARRLADLIDSAVLPAGVLLPSQRSLSEAIAVARGTVTEAYDLLEGLDLVESRQGSGSRVRGRAPTGAGAPGGRLASFSERAAGDIDLSSGALPGLPAVAAAFGRVCAGDVADLVAGDGIHPEGLPRLREAIAEDLSRRGVPTAPEQILITSGAQQAVWLIAGLLVSPGDAVMLEEPTYRGAIEAFQSRGARLVAVPMGLAGLDVGHLARLARGRRPRLLYCQPTAHNPTGITMPSAARRELAAVMAAAGTLVIEDACSADLALDDRPPATPLAGLLPPEQLLTIGTASKLWWGGLRVGWIRGEPRQLRRLVELRKAVDLSGSPVDQLVAACLYGSADAARAERSASLRAGLAEVESMLAEAAPTWQWTHPAGGTGLWVDTGADAVRLAERGRRRGVRIVAGPAFSPTEGLRQYVRIPLGHPPATVLAGISRLAERPADGRPAVPQ